ncbi:hypothetical protein [Paraburkholderia aromaticivorans]|uniref:hypothetical protein n=1 Tax=Paraburkholderia aromaticivorans TaxID=2026199 RepID=UPI0038B8D053
MKKAQIIALFFARASGALGPTRDLSTPVRIVMRRASVALFFRLIPCSPLPASTDDFEPAVAKPPQQHRWLRSPVAFVYFMESWKCRIRYVKARFIT